CASGSRSRASCSRIAPGRRPGAAVRSLAARLGCVQRVRDQDRDCHRPDAARNRRDPRRALARGGEAAVADQPAVRVAVHPDVDHDRARAHPLPWNELRLADRDDEYLGVPAFRTQVARAAVTHGRRAAREQELERHRTAHDVRRADDDGALAFEADAGALEQAHDAPRRARPEPRALLSEQAEVVRMKAVHVLRGTDGLDDFGPVDVSGQRELHEDAVDGLVRIQLPDQAQQLRLARARRQVVREREQADPLAGAALVADVDAGGVVAADEHDGETGRPSAIVDAVANALLDFAAYLRGDGAAVDDVCGPVL